MELAITIMHVAGIALLTISAFLALYRMVMGPTALDRSIAADLIIAILIAATAFHAAITGLSTGLPLLVVMSLLGFTAAVAMARLISSKSLQVRELRDIDEEPDEPEADHA